VAGEVGSGGGRSGNLLGRVVLSEVGRGNMGGKQFYGADVVIGSLGKKSQMN